jgi:hypothetical protein
MYRVILNITTSIHLFLDSVDSYSARYILLGSLGCPNSEGNSELFSSIFF